jgi:two-component system, OmpR family, sensor histidine kinase MtrB
VTAAQPAGAEPNVPISAEPNVPLEVDPSAGGDQPAGIGPARTPRYFWVRSWHALQPGLNRLLSAWRRSLQLRVATSTALVTGVVVLLIGLFLISQIGSGVLKAKRESSIAQATVGQEAAAQFAGLSPGDLNGIQQVVDQITGDTTSTTGVTDLYSRVVLSTDDAVNAGMSLSQQPIPRSLRREVQRGAVAVQYSRVRVGNSEQPGLIVGQPMSTGAGAFELYYLFPLTAEQNTLNLVRQTVLVAGLALVLLVAAIATMVTRWVVLPVRVAAQTAERLAGGDLAQRIQVSGEDDIALLGTSFNDMATSLQQQIQRLEKLSRLQQRFTSDVSHELRTPLTTIRMATELLYASRADFAPELARSAELLNNELDRFESLLAELLEISRYDAGAASLEAEQVDVIGIVERAVQASELLARRHQVQLLALVGSQPVLAELDARRVERILRNLIGNALDHAEGRPVEVNVGYDEDTVAISVRDHGIGLRPGEAGLVFNRFWRGDPSRSRLTGGTGLGLAISLEDARLHNGWLQAWGERGKGSVFLLTLPRTAGGTVTSSPLPLVPAPVVPYVPQPPYPPGPSMPSATGGGAGATGIAGAAGTTGTAGTTGAAGPPRPTSGPAQVHR